MLLVYLDNTGRVWDSVSGALEAELVSSLSGEALARYVAKNMGYVCIASKPGTARIWIRPSKVADAALAAAAYILADQTPKRVMLSYYEDRWYDRLVPGRRIVRELSRMSTLSNQKHLEAYVRQEHGLGQLTPSDPLWYLLECWRGTGMKYAPESFLAALNGELKGRSFLIEHQTHDDQLYFRDVGKGLPMFREFWMHEARDTPVEAMPDYRYAIKTAATYRDALERNAPIFDSIEAEVQAPGREGTRVHYDRILLPCETDDGRKLLLGASVVYAPVHSGLEVG